MQSCRLGAALTRSGEIDVGRLLTVSNLRSGEVDLQSQPFTGGLSTRGGRAAIPAQVRRPIVVIKATRLAIDSCDAESEIAKVSESSG
jgi:hypothetical protein